MQFPIKIDLKFFFTLFSHREKKRDKTSFWDIMWLTIACSKLFESMPSLDVLLFGLCIQNIQFKIEICTCQNFRSDPKNKQVRQCGKDC